MAERCNTEPHESTTSFHVYECIYATQSHNVNQDCKQVLSVVDDQKLGERYMLSVKYSDAIHQDLNT